VVTARVRASPDGRIVRIVLAEEAEMPQPAQRARSEGAKRRPLRVRQPESMAALWPSQRRAAEHRAALSRRRSITDSLRRFAR
jgi:hypothetical protein